MNSALSNEIQVNEFVLISGYTGISAMQRHTKNDFRRSICAQEIKYLN